MSDDAHKNAIQIADDEWIAAGEHDGDYAAAIDIDAYFTGLWPLIDRLETTCVADCCGFDAYDFTRAGVAEALHGLDHTAQATACQQASTALAASAGDIFVSPRMNNYASKQMLLQLLAHLASCIAARR